METPKEHFSTIGLDDRSLPFAIISFTNMALSWPYFNAFGSVRTLLTLVDNVCQATHARTTNHGEVWWGWLRCRLVCA